MLYISLVYDQAPTRCRPFTLFVVSYAASPALAWESIEVYMMTGTLDEARKSTKLASPEYGISLQRLMEGLVYPASVLPVHNCHSSGL